MTPERACLISIRLFLVTLAIVVICSIVSKVWPSPAAPQTAWQRYCATVDRAKLAPWERQWLGREPQRTARAWVTNYGPWDAGRYKGASWHIAANPKYMKPGTVVWLEADKRLKVVTNRGADWNDAWAQASVWNGKPKPVCDFWIDRWTATRRGDNAAQRVWIIGRAPWKH